MALRPQSVWLAVAAALSVAAHGVTAQSLRGIVRDSASAQPIPGAVVMLLDSAGRQLARNITNERGQYTIRDVAGTRRLRVQRIGFRPSEVPVTANRGGAAIDVMMAAIPTFLEAVSVVDQPNCRRRPDRAAAFALWEQARAGLLATVVARESNPPRVRRLTFDRTMDRYGDQAMRQSVHIDSATTDRAFIAGRSVAEFVQRGFMDDSAGLQLFYGPDADVLLHDEFAHGYCFRIMDRDDARPRQIGLGFAPADRQDGRTDIDGALWIDTVARAIVDIRYDYLGLERRITALHPGGRISFRTMDNGMVMIDRWFIRLISNADTAGAGTPAARRAPALQIHEVGGEIAHATWADGREWQSALGRFHGRARQDTASAIGAVLRLDDTDYEATTDARGEFEIADLLPGPYSISAFNAQLAEVGLMIPTSSRFEAARDSTVRATVNVPTLDDYVASRCDGMRGHEQWGLLTGRVTAPDKLPALRADVSMVSADPDIVLRRVRVTTGSDGRFERCNVPRNILMQIRAEREGNEPVSVERRVTGKLTTVVMELKPRRP